MPNKRKLISGKDALRSSSSERVGIAIADGKLERGRYGILVPSDASECICFGKIAERYAAHLTVKFMIYMESSVAATVSSVGEAELKQLPGASSMAELAENCPFNKTENNGSTIGVIASGDGYNMAKEVYGKRASYLKLGMLHPISRDVVLQFAAKHESLVVLDSSGLAEAFLTSLGIEFIGRSQLGEEYDEEKLRLALLCEEPDFTEIADEVPVRD